MEEIWFSEGLSPTGNTAQPSTPTCPNSLPAPSPRVFSTTRRPLSYWGVGYYLLMVCTPHP